MAAYYNDIDPFAAQWLRELITKGHIADGEVDERSIEDVKPSELSGYTQCHFFAGIGVWSHALRKAGVSDCEKVWTGSCPCQPFSVTGKRNGVDDERHLWPSFLWLIKQCRPERVFGEQVGGKAGESWLDTVSTDLEGEDYSCGSAVTAACGFGAPHQRKRIYWVANSNSERLQGERPNSDSEGWKGQDIRQAGLRHRTRSEELKQENETQWGHPEWVQCSDKRWRPVEPSTFPLAGWSADRMGRLRCYGNALVSPQAQAFIESAIN
tara:strand:+ start:3445 stop:4245 length:801 start_codon:yes stop_codon:yes gene_type:complete